MPAIGGEAHFFLGGLLMNILSLSFGHDGLAAVVVDGKLVATTERSREVQETAGINRDTVNHVLAKAQLQWPQIHMVVVTNWFWERTVEGASCSTRPRKVSVMLPNGQPVTREKFNEAYRADAEVHGAFTFRMGDQAPCLMVEHHYAHAAYVFYMSSFDDALVASFDGYDGVARQPCSAFFADGIKEVFGCGAADSRRQAYSSLCDYLGFFPSLTDAGKIMAMAAYGKPMADADKLAPPRAATRPISSTATCTNTSSFAPERTNSPPRGLCTA